MNICYCYVSIISILVLVISAYYSYFMSSEPAFEDFNDPSLSRVNFFKDFNPYQTNDYLKDAYSSSLRLAEFQTYILIKTLKDNFVQLTRIYKPIIISKETTILTLDQTLLKINLVACEAFEVSARLLDSTGKEFVSSIFISARYSGIIIENETITYDDKIKALLSDILSKIVHNSNTEFSLLENNDFKFNYVTNEFLTSDSNSESKLSILSNIHLILNSLLGKNLIHVGSHLRIGKISGKIEAIQVDGKIDSVSTKTSLIAYEVIVTIKLNEITHTKVVYFLEKGYKLFFVSIEKSESVIFYPLNKKDIFTRESTLIAYDEVIKDMVIGASQNLSSQYILNEKSISEEIILISKNLIKEDDFSFFEKTINGAESEINSKFIIQEVDLFNSTQVSAALSIASNRAFKSRFIRVLSYRKGLAYGIMQVLQPNGQLLIITFEGSNVYISQQHGNEWKNTTISQSTIFEGTILFKDENYDENLKTFIEKVYYYASCFNPMINSLNVTSDVVFFPDKEEDDYIPYEKVIIKTSSQLNNLVENATIFAKKSLKEKKDYVFNTVMQNSVNTIKANQTLFEKNIQNSNLHNIPFIVENINYNNHTEVEAGLNVASQRAFGNNFLRIISYRKGKAYGTTEILQPTGEIRQFIFEGNKVSYSTIDNSGKQTIIQDNTSYTHIYEGKAEFKNKNYEINGDTIILNVYYYSACFNPVRYSSNVTNNVTFFPDDSTNENDKAIILKDSDEYNIMFEKARESLFKSSHHTVQFGGMKVENLKNKVTRGILDISGSMISLKGFNSLKSQVENQIGKNNVNQFNGCFFDKVVKTNTVTKVLIDLIDSTENLGSIYFFADFEDHVEEGVFDLIFPKLKEKNIKLYLHSTYKTPHQELLNACIKSGGKLIIEKMK